ncbi:PRR29 protein, partial [Upupa epops]|nr:PRR29 protein [Upupa epops]
LRPTRSPHGAAQAFQQPVMILQQLPGTVAALTPTTRAPHARADLIDLMMIQNSQMHQVVMNSLAVSALTAFGFGPSPATAQVTVVPPETGEEEEPMVFHHHYIPYPGLASILQRPLPSQDGGAMAVRYLGAGSLVKDEEVHAVAPPPPPSATGTVGADVPPASGKDKLSSAG